MNEELSARKWAVESSVKGWLEDNIDLIRSGQTRKYECGSHIDATIAQQWLLVQNLGLSVTLIQQYASFNVTVKSSGFSGMHW